MSTCYLCNKQIDKSKYGLPHEFLQKTGEQRNFTGENDGVSYFEQDYQCSTCKSKFTHSSQKINPAWELWPSGEVEK